MIPLDQADYKGATQNDVASSVAAGIAAGILSGGNSLLTKAKSNGLFDAVAHGFGKMSAENIAAIDAAAGRATAAVNNAAEKGKATVGDAARIATSDFASAINGKGASANGDGNGNANGDGNGKGNGDGNGKGNGDGNGKGNGDRNGKWNGKGDDFLEGATDAAFLIGKSAANAAKNAGVRATPKEIATLAAEAALHTAGVITGTSSEIVHQQPVVNIYHQHLHLPFNNEMHSGSIANEEYSKLNHGGLNSFTNHNIEGGDEYNGHVLYGNDGFHDLASNGLGDNLHNNHQSNGFHSTFGADHGKHNVGHENIYKDHSMDNVHLPFVSEKHIGEPLIDHNRLSLFGSNSQQPNSALRADIDIPNPEKDARGLRSRNGLPEIWGTDKNGEGELIDPMHSHGMIDNVMDQAMGKITGPTINGVPLTPSQAGPQSNVFDLGIPMGHTAASIGASKIHATAF